MILMLAPAAAMTFASLPSGSTYVSDANGLVYINNNSVQDQTSLIAAGCKTLTPIPGGIGTFQGGTAYTVQASDQGNIAIFTNSSPITVTLPATLANGLAPPVGFVVQLLQLGTGQVSAVAASGATVFTPNVATTPNQYSALYCVVISNYPFGTVWDVIATSVPSAGIVGATTLSGLYAQDSSAHYTQYTIAQVFADTVSFTGSISGSVLTTSSVTGTFAVGQMLSYSGAPAGLAISSFGTGTGGAGTYNLSSSPGTVSGIAMTASGTGQWLKTGSGNGSGNWSQQNAYTLAAIGAQVTSSAATITTLLPLLSTVAQIQFGTDGNGATASLPLIDAGGGLYWTYLLLDANRKIVSGKKSDGSEWIANGTGSLLETISPSVAAPVNAPTLASGAGATLPLMDAGSGLFWLNIVLDASRKIISGMKSDGSAWEAQGGTALVQVTSSGAGFVPTYNTDTNWVGPSNPHNSEVYGTLTVVPSNGNFLDLHIGMGQSWDYGSNSAAYDATFTTSPLDGTNCLMPSQGTYPAAWNGTATISSLVALYEKGANGSIETWCSRAGHAVQSGFTAAALTGPTQGFVVSARGGTPYIGLKRGTPTYTQMLNYVSQIKSVAAGMGLTARMRSFVTLQGENDSPTIRDEYANDMVTWRRDLEADVKSITGQTEPIILITIQCNESIGSDPNTSLANVDTMDIDPAHCIVSHPSYCIGPQDNAGGANVGGHFMAMGWVQFGEQIGHAILRHIYGSGHKPVRLKRGTPGAYWSAKSPFTITLAYNRPVFIDTSNTVVDATQVANYGFTFADQSGSPPTITAVTQLAATSSFSVSGSQITFNSFGNLPEAIVVVYNGTAYGMDVNTNTTTAAVAAGFAAMISGATAASGLLSLPSAPMSVTAYSSVLQIMLSAEPLGASVLRYACANTGAGGVGNQTGQRGVVRGPTAFATSAIARGQFSFSGNPAANDTVTVNGVTVTFVASGATGNQVNIAANSAATVSALYTFLSGSANASLRACRYDVSAPGTGLLVYGAASGPTISASSSAIATTAMAAIQQYDWALAQRVDLPPI
jgi:hypothetical protein